MGRDKKGFKMNEKRSGKNLWEMEREM